MRPFFARACILGSMLVATQAQAATINLIDTSGSVAGTQAEAAFGVAASYWGAMLTNDVGVNINVSLADLGANIVGGASSTKGIATTRSVYERLAANSSSALDAVAIANLSPLSAAGGVSMITPAWRNPDLRTGVDWNTKHYDTDDSLNNTTLEINTSLQRALGYEVSSSAIDGRINFSDSFDFDYDPTDGITAGSVDFIGAAIHEIGHILGFISGADTYDDRDHFQTTLNKWEILTPLDLFRYSPDATNLVPGDGLVLDVSPGSASFFSIDGKTVFHGGYFSTGVNFGDGRQASHWKDTGGCGNVQIGLMDPTMCRDRVSVVESIDLAAFDAIGWNLSIDAMANTYRASTADIYRLFKPGAGAGANAVPEPATWLIMIAGFGMIGSALRLRRPAVVQFA